ncbi:MAG TPA: bifunctional 5,10-methylenetetrahydrofolate dehydrogenase/5,10-methenyltetrahydrofolate cyclohydrolase [Thermoanaerobaculia bacterium]|jgi:methylenetetrahydrofolate dehydrogenase (NADP+)/methenyltetrahydrofolate cyclohydrolase|nr:bifunctional 5,10-methylenetetrahydrofolate dehydrogenase/5,10-methenyltetrahydrofolate cyclohydrolase [Thermoanaerobaculia bacterium]
MSLLLEGKTLSAELRAGVTDAVREMTAAGLRPPGLGVILAGDDPASKVYVGSKVKACGEAGLASRSAILPADVPEGEILRILDDFNRDETLDGILVQLPLPGHIDERRVLESVLPEKDVDGFHSHNVGNLWLDLPGFAPATPSGVIELLKFNKIPIAGRRAVVVGRSPIVGKPMAALLLRENATVTICHSRTADLPAVCREADILVVAIGRPGFIGAEHVREGAVVIDVGVSRLEQRAEVERLFGGNEARLRAFENRGSVLAGDVDFHRVAPKASAITPVPGGVGLLTVSMLLVNTLKAARLRQGLPAMVEVA